MAFSLLRFPRGRATSTVAGSPGLTPTGQSWRASAGCRCQGTLRLPSGGLSSWKPVGSVVSPAVRSSLLFHLVFIVEPCSRSQALGGRDLSVTRREVPRGTPSRTLRCSYRQQVPLCFQPATTPLLGARIRCLTPLPGTHSHPCPTKQVPSACSHGTVHTVGQKTGQPTLKAWLPCAPALPAPS